jgi:hypothetical protein
MNLITSCRRNPGDGVLLPKEILLLQAKFKVFKNNNRPKPENKKKILIVCCFSEFGCETIGLMYCIPKIIANNPGAYVICAGWYGREYLYRHLVDEFWEIEQSCMNLREYSNAFTNSSKNIKRIEKNLEEHGSVFATNKMGYLCVVNTCELCKKTWCAAEVEKGCPSCFSENVVRGFLSDISHHRKFAVNVPRPSIKMQSKARELLKPNSVGIFARGRKIYGRNLSSEFYVKLISTLEEMGYNPIWLGEKQSVQPCPVDHIVDFSRMEESRDLELTLAIMTNLQFTIQFWTASTRLASMMGVPWILFESPDQIAGNGQEGKRIALTTDYNKKKLVLAHYFSVVENHDLALDVLKKAIKEMNEDNWEDILGLVEDQGIVSEMVQKQKEWRNM